MVEQPTPTQSEKQFFSRPSHPVGYIAILAALLTAGIHLRLSLQIMGFNQMLGTLFILNGLGFLGGIALYISWYWRRELFLVAAGYAVVTVFAFFAFQGFTPDAFYMRGNLNPMAVGAKAVELVFAICVVYLYTESSP